MFAVVTFLGGVMTFWIVTWIDQHNELKSHICYSATEAVNYSDIDETAKIHEAYRDNDSH